MAKKIRLRTAAQRQVVILACVVAMVCVVGCSNPDAKNVKELFDKISHSPESELTNHLYGYSRCSPGAQQVLLGMLKRLHAPSPEQHMSVEATRRSGRFTMIVARVPWPRGTEPAGFQPIIITGDAGREQVVGTILPFDDILPLMQAADMQSISELTQWWIQNYVQKRGI